MFSFFIFLCRSETTFTYDDATKTLTINADSYYDYNKIDEICPGRPFTKAIYTGTYQELVSSTFRNSRLLTTVEIGENVKSINMYVFTNCVSLREFIIPPNVESIGQYCFKGCTGLTSIKWHRSNMEFNIFCFAGLTSLETFTQAEGDNTTEVPGKKHIYYEKCFRDCSKLRTVTLPPNIGNLDLYTFYGCKSLTGFVFPPELKKCRCHCFENCESLPEMDLSNVEWLGNYVSELFFSNKLRDVMGNTFNGCVKLPELTGLETNEYFTFKRRFLYNCRSLTHFKIPKMMTRILYESLRGCTSLTQLTLHDGITFIEHDAFAETGITKLVMPSELKTMEVGIFKKCSNLRSLDFRFCYKLRRFPNNLLYQDTSLSEIILPPRMESVPDFAFSETAIETITFPETFRQFGKSVFLDCPKLKTVYIFGNSIFLSTNMFSKCPSLSKIYINPEISGIEKSTFDGISQNVEIIYCSNRIFTDTTVNQNSYLSVKVPTGYEKDNFCGLSITKVDGQCTQHPFEYPPRKDPPEPVVRPDDGYVPDIDPDEPNSPLPTPTPNPNPGTETDPDTKPGTETDPDTKPGTETDPDTKPGTETDPDTKPRTETDSKPNPDTKPGTETDPDTKPGTETDSKPNPDTKPGTDTEPEVSSENKPTLPQTPTASKNSGENEFNDELQKKKEAEKQKKMIVIISSAVSAAVVVAAVTIVVVYFMKRSSPQIMDYEMSDELNHN